MGTVLYEASTGYGSIVESLAIPIVMFLFMILLPRLKRSPEAAAGGWRPRRMLWLLCGAFVILGIFFILRGQLDMYRRVIVPYARGEYEVVEGPVENFVPMPSVGHADETFDIDGVHFAYSDNNVTVGYRNTRVKGGVVRGNGQYLRVGYVYYNESYGNIIVYIEELTDPSD